MHVYDKALLIPPLTHGKEPLQHFNDSLKDHIKTGEIPMSFVVTRSDEDGYHCELTTLVNYLGEFTSPTQSILDFQKRKYENTEQFNAVLLIPTGVDCEIGGDAGDATPVARLLASTCDHLIIHPNVVNASDINELSDNCLYVEGSVICRASLDS